MKYISKQKGDTTYLIPTGDPPPGKVIKSDLPKYLEMKKRLLTKMQWKNEKDKKNASMN